jgi:hypothetical protein
MPSSIEIQERINAIAELHSKLNSLQHRLKFELLPSDAYYASTRFKLPNGLYIHAFIRLKDIKNFKLQIEINTGNDHYLDEELSLLVKNGNKLAELNNLDELWNLAVDKNQRKLVFESPTGKTEPVGTKYGNCIQLAKFCNEDGKDLERVISIIKLFLHLIGVIKRNETLLTE